MDLQVPAHHGDLGIAITTFKASIHSLTKGQTPGMVGLAFFVTGLGWSGLASFLSNRAGLERAGLGWQVLTKTGLQGFSLA